MRPEISGTRIPGELRSKDSLCLSMHMGVHANGCRVRVGAHGDELDPHWTPPTASLTPPADWFDGRCDKMETRYSQFKG